MKKFLVLILFLSCGCTAVTERDGVAAKPRIQVTLMADDPAAAVPITVQSGAYFDAPLLNEDGTPYDDHSHYELALAMVGADLNAGVAAPRFTKRLNCSQPTCGVNIRDFFGAELGEGEQAVWVRAVDMADNASLWAGPLLGSSDTVAPGMPRNLVIEIKLTVTP
jgi:hypothetical protein